jgi:glucokinase
VTETIIEAAHYLGLGLASAINLLNPARIILGGGVIEAVDLLMEVAAGRARREALVTPGKRVEIVKARLGDYSGVVGAAILGAQAAGRN